MPLKSGGGPLGMSRIVLEEKIKLLGLDEKKYVHDNQMLSKLRIDGVYVTDPQLH